MPISKEKNLYISVIVPVYNSDSILPELLKRIESTISNDPYEIILINDQSLDKSWQKICELSKHNKRVRGINLRKNVGQDCAIMAGLHSANGKIIIIMDDDLQHDPRDIPILVRKVESGYDVCYAKFSQKKQSIFKNLGSWFNDKIANIVIGKPKGLYLSPYKAIRLEIVKEVLNYDGPYPYIDGLIFRNTINITQETITHHKRFSGKGNINIIKSISVWLRVVTNFSIFPLRIASYLGFFASIVGFVLGLMFIIQYYLGIESPQGWPSLIVTILFIGGIQLLSLGILGEYIGRSFLHQNKEPQFVVKDTTWQKGD
tara:strand:+ start:992 stop:1939 length:948 start_codon:yes stop_codon:yes gene_type:complete